MSSVIFLSCALLIIAAFVTVNGYMTVGAIISTIGAAVAVVNLIVYLRKRKTN